jgi:hypothetical protein
MHGCAKRDESEILRNDPWRITALLHHVDNSAHEGSPVRTPLHPQAHPDFVAASMASPSSYRGPRGRSPTGLVHGFPYSPARYGEKAGTTQKTDHIPGKPKAASPSTLPHEDLAFATPIVVERDIGIDRGEVVSSRYRQLDAGRLYELRAR